MSKQRYVCQFYEFLTCTHYYFFYFYYKTLLEQLYRHLAIKLYCIVIAHKRLCKHCKRVYTES